MGDIWVTSYDADQIDVLRGTDGQVLYAISLPYGSAPFGIVISPDGASAYVSLEGSGRVVRIDTATRAVTASLDLGPSPRAMALSAP